MVIIIIIIIMVIIIIIKIIIKVIKLKSNNNLKSTHIQQNLYLTSGETHESESSQYIIIN